MDSLLTGRVYINLYDSRNPTGELRGQLVLETSLHFEVNYNGAQESPPVSAAGGGTGVFVLNSARTQIDYWVTYHGLTGLLTSGEIGAGAPGMNGSVVRTIAEPGNPTSATVNGLWKTTDNQPLTDALVDSLIAGSIYSNFLTSAHQDGEIRGQLVLRGGFGFVASLDSSQESPVTRSHASATASFVLNETRNQLTYNLTYIGLSSNLTDSCHIYSGSPGTIGSIAKTIPLSGDTTEATISGTWQFTDAVESLTPDLVNSLFEGGLYIEIQSGADTAGDVRGQINLTTGIGFTARLSASQDVPPTVKSNGTGTASVVLSPDRQSVLYSLTFLDLSSNISQAGGHIHEGAPGANGEQLKVIVPPNSWGALSVNGVWSTSDGDHPLTPEIVGYFITDYTYINLHTGDYMGGEIRGQVSYDYDVSTPVIETPWNGPGEFHLEQNYPNPFNPTTNISYQLPINNSVSLKIYDVLGREVKSLVNERQIAGTHSVTLNAGNLPSGVYFYRLQAGSFTETKKLVLVK